MNREYPNGSYAVLDRIYREHRSFIHGLLWLLTYDPEIPATTDRHKSDAVGNSSHFIDSHHVQRVTLSPTQFVKEGHIWRLGWAYQIPYHALTPKKAECVNLLTPGAASFSHVAFCSYRLESVWMIGGHAAGVAAAMAAAGNRSVQDVPVADRQKRLREQRQVIDFVPDAPQKWPNPKGGTGGPTEV